jgi:hypothetical protein
MRALVFSLTLVSFAAAAQDAAFDSGNRFLAEQSFSKACDAFSNFLKASPESPLAREATVKRAFTCWKIGKKDGSTELTRFADTGEKDFARAWAMWALTQQGYRQFDLAIPLLQQAMGGEGRQANEARALLVAGALRALDQSQYDPKAANRLAEVVLQASKSPRTPPTPASAARRSGCAPTTRSAKGRAS